MQKFNEPVIKIVEFASFNVSTADTASLTGVEIHPDYVESVNNF